VTRRQDWFGTVTGKVAFDPTLSDNAVRIYVALVMHRNSEDNTCFPSNETLARYTGKSVATVKRGLAELVEKRIIKRTDRFKDGRQTTSMTRLTDAR
jgi:predicted transcriptional regulator